MTPLESPGLLSSLLAFFAVLGPLVFIHELGHYWVGRLCGIRAEAFSIGFGREIAGWTDKRGTRWKVGWLPLGGYVMFAGDRDVASSAAADGPLAPDSFPAAAMWKRALTVAAGPVANFLLAFLILAGFALTMGRVNMPPVVRDVVAGSAAAEAGLQPGDRILTVDGRRIENFVDIPMAIAHRPGETLLLTVDRAGAPLRMQMTPRLTAERDAFGNRVERAMLGIRGVPPVITPVSVTEAPGIAINQSWAIVRQMGEVIGQVLTGRRSLKDLGGPIRIAKASGEQAALGAGALVFFIALISINLGFINLLPLPMLDGGHLMFYAIEAIRRRPVSAAAQEWAFRAGFAGLALLMIVVTFNDLGSIGLWDRLRGLIG